MKDSESYKAPIVIIGAGVIVNDAHLPAYQLAGFDVAGIYDVDKDKAHATALKFNIPLVFDSMEDIVRLNLSPVVYDVAVPGSAIRKVLDYLPAGSSVLIQKPMGDDYQEAKAILQYARDIALEILNDDPLLNKPDNLQLQSYLLKAKNRQVNWGMIS